MSPRVIEKYTVVDPPAKSATIQSSEVGFTEMLTDPTSAGVTAFGVIGVASDSTDGVPGKMAEHIGRVALITVVLTVRGDRVKGWMAGAARSYERPIWQALDSNNFPDS